ncbi:uncharacterized protein LOC119681232 [Teleopsis dalmanni]|nr:uncharacterized protein LOC119681232 [Teleopsis dalmanni]
MSTNCNAKQITKKRPTPIINIKTVQKKPNTAITTTNTKSNISTPSACLRPNNSAAFTCQKPNTLSPTTCTRTFQKKPYAHIRSKVYQRKPTITINGKQCQRKSTTYAEFKLKEKLQHPPFFQDDIDAETATFQNCRKEFQAEVQAFKKTLRELELELTRPRSFNISEINEQTVSTNDLCSYRERLKKSFSANDIGNYRWIWNEDPIETAEKEIFKAICSPEPHAHLIQPMNLSNGNNREETKVCSEKLKEENRIIEPKTNPTTSNEISMTTTPTIIETPVINLTPVSKVSSNTDVLNIANLKANVDTKNLTQEQTFPMCNTSTLNKSKIHYPAIIYPVARQNLAATLRAEVAKKKLEELATYDNPIPSPPPYDWGVRKTPAWKSLSYNESHKEILNMRLATRKAEQEFQQRAYEKHLAQMRMRVKTAPLLLEGKTHWGPTVGKVSHTCRVDDAKFKQKLKRSKSCKKHKVNGSSGSETNLPLFCKICAASYTAASQPPNEGRRTTRPFTYLTPELFAAHFSESCEELSSSDRAQL